MLCLSPGVGAIEVFSRSMSDSTGPVKLVNPGMMPAGMPVSRMASRSARGQAGVGDVGGEPLVVGGRQRVPLVLVAERDQDLVDQRVAEPRHLAERPAVDVLAVVGVPHPDALATRR